MAYESNTIKLAPRIGQTWACNCVGPQNGQPKCPCMMRSIIERDGRWVQSEQDLGPVRREADTSNKEWFHDGG